MKIYFNITVFLSIIFAQFSTNNLNGFGNDMDITSTCSESMGGMWMNNSNENGWDPLRASSIHKTDLTMIAISSSVQGIESNAYNVNNHYLNYVNFSLPIGKSMGIGIGLSPYTRANYTFQEEPYMISGTEFSLPLLSRSSHVIEGGISKLSLAISKGITLKNSHISMGFKWNILFGNQNMKTETTLEEISYDQVGNMISTLIEDSDCEYNHNCSIQYNHFKAYLYEIDSKITIKRNSFSFLISLMDNFEVDRYEANQFFSYSNNYLLNKIQLDQFGIGYMYNKNDDFGIAVEGHFKNSIDYPEEIMLFNSSYPSKISFHNGIYKKFKNSKSGSWNSINLSAGYSYKIIKFTNQDLNDISFSVGTGISFNEWKNNIDISLTIGSSKNIIETINRDDYYKLNITIFSGDKWFAKRRRK